MVATWIHQGVGSAACLESSEETGERIPSVQMRATSSDSAHCRSRPREGAQTVDAIPTDRSPRSQTGAIPAPPPRLPNEPPASPVPTPDRLAGGHFLVGVQFLLVRPRKRP